MEAAPDTSTIVRASADDPAPQRGTPSSALFWLVGFAAWTALALLSTTQTALTLSMRGQPIDWPRLLEWRAIDSAAIRATALDYIDGWYTGDAARMERALHPELVKRIVMTDAQDAAG